MLFNLVITSVFAEKKVECEHYKSLVQTGDVDKLPFELTYHYQQVTPALQDAVGDIALMRLVKDMPKNLIWMIRHQDEKLMKQNQQIQKFKSCAEEVFSLSVAEEDRTSDAQNAEGEEIKDSDEDVIEKSDLTLPDKERLLEVMKDGVLVIEGKVPPFYPVKLANMFTRVIQEEAKLGIQPAVGEFHRFSKGFIRKHYLEFFPFTMMSKTLLSLARGDTAKYMITGLEPELKKWILEQAENSITLDKMFRRSYQLNNGNVYASLLTVENVLAQEWRNPKRAELATTKRLKLFTNTIGTDDRFGNWYHLFGIMLYGYVKNRVSAKIIGTIEGVGSDLLQPEKEKQENIINRKGGKVGALLHQRVKSGKWNKEDMSEDFLKEEYYLHQQLDFNKPLKKSLKRAPTKT